MSKCVCVLTLSFQCEIHFQVYLMDWTLSIHVKRKRKINAPNQFTLYNLCDFLIAMAQHTFHFIAINSIFVENNKLRRQMKTKLDFTYAVWHKAIKSIVSINFFLFSILVFIFWNDFKFPEIEEKIFIFVIVSSYASKSIHSQKNDSFLIHFAVY